MRNLFRMISASFVENGRILFGSCLTITLVLGLLLALVLAYKNAVGIMGELFQTERFTLILADGVDEATRGEIVDALHNIEGTSGFKVMEPEEVKLDLARSLAELESELGAIETDFFPAVVEFNLPNPDEQAKRSIEALSRRPETAALVNPLDREDAVGDYFAVVDSLGLFFVAFVAVAFYFIVENCIKLMAFGQRKTMEICRLMGARLHFIYLPFLFQLAGLIVVSFGLAVVSIYFLYELLIRFTDQLGSDFVLEKFASFFSWAELAFMIMALLLFSLFGSYFAFAGTLKRMGL